jgi:hypothetical protein
MKIGEVKKGTEYACKEERHYKPRRVLALGTEKVEETYWLRNNWQRGTRNVTKVKVKFLDAPPNRWGTAKKGSTALVHARDLGPEWSELAPRLKQQAEDDAKQKELQDEMTKLAKQVLGRNFDGYFTARVGGLQLQLSMHSKSQIVKLFELAKKGKDAS